MMKSVMLGAMFVLSACTTTTVVLVPDPDGKVGRVNVSNRESSQLLAQQGQAAVVGGKTATIKSDTFNAARISKTFATVLQNEPLPPQRFIFLFESGSAELSADSQSTVDAILVAIKERNSCDNSVIGHSDRTGTPRDNEVVSRQRANAVARALVARGIGEKCMDIRYYGDTDPVVRTAAGVSEPRNRRVEVEVR
ncbi:MAG: OmpA family protein [Moraxellaceae bacterium]|nr:OmpA family protein [Moraxellaceae bacterium]